MLQVVRCNREMLEESRQTLTITPSLMFRILASLRGHLREQRREEEEEEERDIEEEQELLQGLF